MGWWEEKAKEALVEKLGWPQGYDTWLILDRILGILAILFLLGLMIFLLWAYGKVGGNPWLLPVF